MLYGDYARAPIRRIAMVLFGPCEIEVEADNITISQDDGAPVFTLTLENLLEEVAVRLEGAPGSNPPAAA